MVEQRQNIFSMMKAENFTTFTVDYNHQTKEIALCVKKEWSKKIEWKGSETKGLLKRVKKIDTAEVEKLISNYQLDGIFEKVLHCIKIGKHNRLELIYDPVSEAQAVIALHNTKKEHTVGGIRRAVFTKPSDELIFEILNLSREMTFRCAAAKLPCGGACLGIQAQKEKAGTSDTLLGFLGYVTSRYEVKWGIESGFTKEEIKKINKYDKKLVTNKKVNAELISASAAYSVYIAIKEALEYRYPKNPNVEGKLIGIQGVGKLGSKLADMLLEEGADIIITDMNREQLDTFMKKNIGRKKSIDITSINEIQMQMGHVFSPCAYSRVLSRDSIREIEYHIIVGGANHLLQADNIEEELVIANRFMKKGILYIPDWISNAGAVISGTYLFLSKKVPTLDDMKKIIDEACRPVLKEILQISQEKEISPLEAAYKKFEPMVYSENN